MDSKENKPDNQKAKVVPTAIELLTRAEGSLPIVEHTGSYSGTKRKSELPAVRGSLDSLNIKK